VQLDIFDAGRVDIDRCIISPDVRSDISDEQRGPVASGEQRRRVRSSL
jgi:hypothetical protein